MGIEYIINNADGALTEQYINGSLSATTVSADTLYITSVGSGTPQINLGLDSNFQVVTGTTGGALDLQAVTDNGNTTTNLIFVNGINTNSVIKDGSVEVNNLTTNTFTAIGSQGVLAIRTGTKASELKNTNVTNSNVVLEFPNKPTGSYTIATTNDLTSGYTYEIGEYVPSQGGVIFHRYKDGTNENYLVVDTTNVSSSSFWSNINNVSIGATARSTWDGLSNSDAIVAQVGFTSGAAKSCLDSTNNGQTDWYLPAIDELSLLWQNRFNVNRTLSGNSSFGSIPGATQIGYNHSYWSSTEYDGTGAWFFGFGGGSAYIGNKNANQFVRAVRKISI